MIQRFDRELGWTGKINPKEVGKIAVATLVLFIVFELVLRSVYFLRNSKVAFVFFPNNAVQDFSPVPPGDDPIYGWKDLRELQ